MRVLVVIPTQGNRPEMIREAIESVETQTRKADELVITAGGRFDDRVNSAIENSSCDAFLILADDDKLDPEYIEKTVDEMERRKVDIVYTNCHIFGKRNCIGGALGEWKQENIERNTVPLCTSLCRKSAWERAGKYVQVPFYDWHFWWRCFYTGATAYWLKQPLFWWRDHDSGASRNEDLVNSRNTILALHNKLRPTYAIRH